MKYIDCYGNYYCLYNIDNNINDNFKNNYNLIFIHNFLVFYKNNSRLGSRAQKNKSKLKYSTRKLYKQKGTGRARAGALSSPIRRKGAHTFPSLSFEKFSQKINKKNYKLIIFIIFSKFMKDDKFFLIDDLFFIKINTKFFIKKIFKYNLYKFSLLSVKVNYNFFLSQRNYFNINLLNLSKLNPLILIKYDKILFTMSSLNYIYKL